MLPNIPIPRFEITVKDEGLSPDSIYHLITKPIVNKVQSLPNLSFTAGSSYMGMSKITAEFEVGSSPIVAYRGIKSKLTEIADKLPSSALQPVIRTVTLESLPVIWLSVQSKTKTLLQLSHLIDERIKPDLEGLGGVEGLDIIGQVPKKIRVHLNPEAMTKYLINLDMVYQAFKEKNVIVPGGTVNTETKKYFLKMDLKLQDINAIENMVVTYRDNVPIRMRDVATVVLQQTPETTYAYQNGKPRILVGVKKTESANTLTVIAEVKKYLNNTFKQANPEVHIKTRVK